MDKKKKNLPLPAVQMALFYDPDRHRMSWQSIPLSLKARVVECLAQLLCESSDTSDNGEDDDE
jgi:hypothetical protein